MAKKVKFPLDMGNDVSVRTLDELKENYNTEKVTEYFLDGRLLTWLSSRYYDDEAEQVRELAEQGDKNNLAAKLGKIFGIEIEAEEVDVDALEIKREKLDKLRKITSDDRILENVDLVAFSQEELGDLLDEEAEVIYLYGEKFRIPFSVKNTRYVGVNCPVVTISGKDEIDLEANGIVFENCEFSEDTRERLISNNDNNNDDNEEILEEYDDEDFTNDADFKFENKSFKKNKIDGDGGKLVCLSKYTGSGKVIVVPDVIEAIGSEELTPFGYIYGYIFCRCSASVIKLPDGLLRICEGAFCDCDNLIKINIPDGIKRIREYTFAGCVNLKDLILPDGLIEIGNSAFANCQSFKRMDIPDGVTSIGEYAFEGCTDLERVTIPNSVTKIGDNAFDDCENIVVDYDGSYYKYGQLKSLYIKINKKKA